MINGSTLPVTSANIRCSFIICNVPVRSLLSLKQIRLIAASATISSSAAQSSVSALDSANSISENVQANGKSAETSPSFFSLFRDYGFKDSQIQKLSEYPRLGRASVENLKPKLDCLVEIGFTGELLHNLIVSNPYILLSSLDCRIKPNLQILKQYLGSDENVVRAINRYKWILTNDLERCLIPNIELLINEGVPVDRVSKLLLLYPAVLLQRCERVAYAVKTVNELGIEPDAALFIYGLQVVCGFSESNMRKKLDVFKCFGWSDEQVSNVFKRHPACFSLSEENLKSKMGLLLDTLKLEPETVIADPTLLGYSAERIRARYEVLKILKSKKLISPRGMKIPLASGLKKTEDRFLERYIVRYEASVPGLLDLYYDILNQKKEQQIV